MRKERTACSAASAVEDLATALARVGAMNTSELRSFWLARTGFSPSRQLSGDLLKRMILHQIQELHLGKLDRRLTATLDRLAEGRGIPIQRLRTGTVLVREYGGVHHQVAVVDQGYAWNEQTYSSLSAVAKAITGTIWNGHRFFGLGSRHSSPKQRDVDRQPADLLCDGLEPDGAIA